MSEQPAEPAEAPQEDRIDTLEKKVDQILGMLTGQKTQAQLDHDAGARDAMLQSPAADPKAEMRAELAKLQRAEAAKKARASERQANDARLKAIEDKISEKPPEEYSKITNFMRWRDKPKEKQA